MRQLFTTILILPAFLLLLAALAADRWVSLQDDGLHDPANPAIKILQQPAEALSVLQPDGAGNGVNWVTALQLGEIDPRSSIENEIQQEMLELDVIMTDTLPLPYVIFSHRPHVEWMTCDLCHESVFVSKIGENPMNMGNILNGEYCGVCHGAVSFPLTECNRCHSVKPENINIAPSSGAIVERDPL